MTKMTMEMCFIWHASQGFDDMHKTADIFTELQELLLQSTTVFINALVYNIYLVIQITAV